MMSKKNRGQENELDLLEMTRVIWSKRLFIAQVTGIFIVLGLIVAFTSKVEYRASSKLLPESQENGMQGLGGLGGLAGIAGFDVSGIGEGGELSPELYPEIVKSTLFLDTLINASIYFEKQDTMISSFLYFKEVDKPSLLSLAKEYTIGLPGKIKEGLSSDNGNLIDKHDLIRYTKKDWDLLISFSERLSVSVDPKTGIINIDALMPDPVAAAKTADLLVSELTRIVTEYRLEKVSRNLEFTAERFNETKLIYEQKQRELALFNDQNRNIINSVNQTELERLQNELDIAFEVYKGLATQLEQAKIKVKEKTPVFTVLEPVKIPVEKDSPKRKLILVLSAFIGVLISTFIIIVKNLFG